MSTTLLCLNVGKYMRGAFGQLWKWHSRLFLRALVKRDPFLRNELASGSSRNPTAEAIADP